VFFVSHNMAALRSLCQRGFVLERGKLDFEGNIDECIDRYLSKLLNVHHGPSVVFPKPPNSSLCISSATVMCNGVPATTLYMGDSLTLSVDFVSQMPIRHPRLAFILTTHTGIPILNSSNRYQTSPQYVSPVSAGTIRCDLGIVPLAAGRYVISLYFGNQTEDTHVVEDALSIEVIEKDIWRQGQSFRANVSHLWWPTNFLFLTP